MEDCRCTKYDKTKDLLLDIFIVSSHLKLLRCVKCGGLIGEWTCLLYTSPSPRDRS